MKNLAKVLTIAALTTISTFTMAANTIEDKSLLMTTTNMVIDNYVAVMTAGESASLEYLFTSDYTQRINGNQTVNYNRKEIIEYLKKQKGEQLNCVTTTQMIEESADYAVAKVIQKFEHFTRTDFITLQKDGAIWKVSKTVSTYK